MMYLSNTVGDEEQIAANEAEEAAYWRNIASDNDDPTDDADPSGYTSPQEEQGYWS